MKDYIDEKINKALSTINKKKIKSRKEKIAEQKLAFKEFEASQEIIKIEEEKINKAKTTLAWSIGGLILLFLSYAIVRFVVQVILSVGEV